MSMPDPLQSADGHLNAEISDKPHGLPDSTADHPLLSDGPQPNSLEAAGAPDASGLTAPVC